ncbi:hypothetical protein [Leucobacter coleopterorum]|uniref:hypothetical protein n=1 Tax=Leucobacter coleopterorum TaxID=2714933 RepID=UPI001FCB88C9|nr:hypothetical protein [Leucobacter coleopterorum]
MLRRIVPATAAAVLLLTGLTACSAQQDQSSDCVAQLKPGAFSDGVKVKNGFGELPEVTIPKDIDIEVSQRSFAEKAKDRSQLAGENTLVSMNMALYDATTSTPVYASPAFSGEAAGPEFLMVSKEQSNPVSEAVRCAAVGDRIVVGISAKDAAQISGDDKTTLVGVIDVVAESPFGLRARHTDCQTASLLSLQTKKVAPGWLCHRAMLLRVLVPRCASRAMVPRSRALRT